MRDAVCSLKPTMSIEFVKYFSQCRRFFANSSHKISHHQLLHHYYAMKKFSSLFQDYEFFLVVGFFAMRANEKLMTCFRHFADNNFYCIFRAWFDKNKWRHQHWAFDPISFSHYTISHAWFFHPLFNDSGEAVILKISRLMTLWTGAKAILM